MLKGVGQTEGMVTPRCAASATWNPHVDVKGLEDAAGTGLWQCRGLLGVAVGHGAGKR